jgi:methanogenic corrinoid protein MtbC1/DNA-binding XRE family transcriptional regulator
MSDFATRLRELRTRRGLRQKDLASAMGLAQTTIANYEQKLRFPDEPMLVRIADYFDVSLDQLMGRDNGAPPAQPPAGGPEPGSDREKLAHGDLVREYLRLQLGESRDAALALARQAIAAGMGLPELYVDVLAPALREAGRRWARGELSVGEEHLVSEATLQLMATLRAGQAAESAAAPRSKGRATVLVAAGETHVIGPRMVGDLLELEGWEVRFPGGNLSLRHARELLRDRPPHLLLISVTRVEYLNSADDLVRMARAEKGLERTAIIVGGQAFLDRPEAWKELGADAVAGNAREAVQIASRFARDKG